MTTDNDKKALNGKAKDEAMTPTGGTAEVAPTGPDPDVLKKVEALRARVNETFGRVALAMMATPRYRHLPIGDLTHLVLDPLVRDRIAIAQPAKPSLEDGGLAGLAIWASVSQEVDATIREQIKAGVFPVRLKPDDWTSGKINWLLDVLAPTPKLATAVLANFKQVVKEGDLRIHPMVTRLIDPETLKKMGASPISG